MRKNNQRKTTSLTGISSILAACLLFGAGQALAGFVWTPPPAKPAAAPAAADNGPAMGAVPVAPVDTSNGGPDTLPLPPPSPSASRPDNLATFLPPAPDSKGAGDFIDLQGFGKDLPLHVVVKQVVQPGFTTVYAPGVDTDTLVSWNGGKPWNAVLQDALAPVNLQAAIQGRRVTIQPAGGAPLTAASPVPANNLNGGPDSAATDAPMPLGAFKAPPSSLPSSLPTSLPPAASAPGTDTIQWNTPAYAGVTDRATETAVAATPLAPPVGMRPGDVSSAPVEAPRNDTAMAAAPLLPVTAPVTMPATAPNSSSPDSLPQEWAPPPAPRNDLAAAAADTGPDLSAVDHWQAAKGDSLHTVLNEWCARAGVVLIWQVERDYELRKTVDLKGDFPDAVTRLLTLYNDSRPRPTGTLHPHLPGGRAALIVGTQ